MSYYLSKADIPYLKKLGEEYTTEEIAKMIGKNQLTLKNYCSRHKIKTRRKPYTVTQKVLDARRARTKKNQYDNDVPENTEENRIDAHKKIAENNILCAKW